MKESLKVYHFGTTLVAHDYGVHCACHEQVSITPTLTSDPRCVFLWEETGGKIFCNEINMPTLFNLSNIQVHVWNEWFHAGAIFQCVNSYLYSQKELFSNPKWEKYLLLTTADKLHSKDWTRTCEVGYRHLRKCFNFRFFSSVAHVKAQAQTQPPCKLQRKALEARGLNKGTLRIYWWVQFTTLLIEYEVIYAKDRIRDQSWLEQYFKFILSGCNIWKLWL